MIHIYRVDNFLDSNTRSVEVKCLHNFDLALKDRKEGSYQKNTLLYLYPFFKTSPRIRLLNVIYIRRFY